MAWYGRLHASRFCRPPLLPLRRRHAVPALHAVLLRFEALHARVKNLAKTEDSAPHFDFLIGCQRASN